MLSITLARRNQLSSQIVQNTSYIVMKEKEKEKKKKETEKKIKENRWKIAFCGTKRP